MENTDKCSILFEDKHGSDSLITASDGIYTLNFKLNSVIKSGGYFSTLGSLFRGIIRHKHSKKESINEILELYSEYKIARLEFLSEITKFYDPVYEIRKHKINFIKCQ